MSLRGWDHPNLASPWNLGLAWVGKDLKARHKARLKRVDVVLSAMVVLGGRLGLVILKVFSRLAGKLLRPFSNQLEQLETFSDLFPTS